MVEDEDIQGGRAAALAAIVGGHPDLAAAIVSAGFPLERPSRPCEGPVRS